MWRSLPARIVTVLVVWQLLASAITIGRGFPYYGSSLVDNAPVWELPIAVWHLPAIELLSAAGYCCGLRNQVIFEARVRGGHVALRPFGALVLAASSWAFWSVLAVIGLALWRRRRPAEEAVAAQIAEEEQETAS
jgi:hypothetical protein